MQQAALENLLAKQLEAADQLRDVLPPQPLEAQMLHRVGCNRFRPARQDYNEAYLITVEDQPGEQDPDVLYTQLTEAAALPRPSSFSSSSSSSFLFNGLSDSAFSDPRPSLFDDLNEDARSDMVDLLSIATQSFGGQQGQGQRGQMPGSFPFWQQQGSSSSSSNGGFASHMLLRGNGGGDSGSAWVLSEQTQPQRAQGRWDADAGLPQAAVSIVIEVDQEEDDDYYDLSSLSASSLGERTTLLDEVLLLRALFWPFTSSSSSSDASSTATAAIARWSGTLVGESTEDDDDAFLPFATSSSSSSSSSQLAASFLGPEHFNEEDLAASLASHGVARDLPLPLGRPGLDLDGDGIPDLDLALFGPDGDLNWRLLTLLLLLGGTAVMAAACMRSLLQLAAAMRRHGGMCGGGGRQGHVLVPVTLQRGGELVHGLMMVPEGDVEGGAGMVLAGGKSGAGGWKGWSVVEGGQQEEKCGAAGGEEVGVVVAREFAEQEQEQGRGEQRGAWGKFEGKC